MKLVAWVGCKCYTPVSIHTMDTSIPYRVNTLAALMRFNSSALQLARPLTYTREMPTPIKCTESPYVDASKIQ